MVRQALVTCKDPLKPDEKCGVIYRIECDTCEQEYVGETGSMLSTNTKEYKSSVLNKNIKSALGEHVLNK